MAVAVGDVITAADINAIDDAATGALPHEEWTATSASVATATTASVGTLTRNAGTSNETLASISTNTLTISASGIYDISWAATLAAAPTGAFFIRVFDGTNTYQAVGTTVSGVISVSVAGIRIPASTVLTFTFYHVSAANRVLTSNVIALTKTGTY